MLILEIYSYSRRQVSLIDFGAVKLLPKWLILQEKQIYRCHWHSGYVPSEQAHGNP